MKKLVCAALVCTVFSSPVLLANDRPTTYVPEGGYASTTKATYVEPSVVTILKPGQQIKDYIARGYSGEPFVQRLSERTYWIGKGFYNTIAYVGDAGVLVMDPLAYGAGEGVIDAIGSITDKPIRAVIYSHHHEDHIDDIGMYVTAAKKASVDLRIIASEVTANGLKQSESKLPEPTEILKGNTATTKFEDVTIQMTLIEDSMHTYDSAAWKLVEEDVLHIPDVVNPDQLPYLGFGGSLKFEGYEENMQQVRDIGFTFFSGGHGNIGSMADFDFMQTYVEDLKAAVGESFGAASPKDYFVPKYNNHQASAHAWFEVMNKAALDALRPKYGDYYGFEVSVPYQIRMVRDYMLD